MKYELLIGTVLSLLLTVKASGIDLSNIDVNELKSQLPGEFAMSNFSMEDFNALFKKKCVKVAGEEMGQKAFEEIEVSALELAECVNNIVNFTAIQEEINIASPHGELDAVFHKYCLKRPDALKCVENFNSKLTPCLDSEERENQEMFLRIIRSLLDFVCYKGGDQIALFIAEKGPECIESHQDDIQSCINGTLSNYRQDEDIKHHKSLPKFVMGPKQCHEMERLESCIVKNLENCEEITPANIVESMFRFIKNETVCRSIPNTDKQIANNAGVTASSITISHLSLLLTLFVAMLAYSNRKSLV